MLRSLALKASLASLVVACALSAASAQTGPSYKSPVPGNGGGIPSNKMTPDRAAKLLRADGHSVQVRTFPNGGKTVIATVLRDGWRFVVELEFNAQGNNLNVVCPLGNPISKISATQLQQLLAANYTLPGVMRFSFRASDQRLCLEDPFYATANMSDAGLRNILNNITGKARETHKLWDTSQGPVS
jgi:hypothetical protein